MAVPAQAQTAPSPLGTPVVAMIHPGTHAFPRGGPALIVKFFREHVKP